VNVRIPTDDRPSPLALILVALSALFAGIFIAWWASDDAPEEQPRRRSAPRAEAEPEVEPPPPPEPEPAAPTSTLRVRRGRIAYLRCEPESCPRDEAMEEAVWAAIEALPSCAEPPPAAGEADIRVDYVAGAAPIVGWRDTFPDVTVRLDEARVMSCLEEPLGATRQTTAQRLLVSFRFLME
jgi:hypothetical protein